MPKKTSGEPGSALIGTLHPGTLNDAAPSSSPSGDSGPKSTKHNGSQEKTCLRLLARLKNSW